MPKFNRNWEEQLAPSCSTYTTVKVVAIRDAKLCGISIAFTVVVFIYSVVVRLLLQHGYALFEVPTGHTTIWRNLPADESNTGPFPHCTGPIASEYSWGLDNTPAEQQQYDYFSFGPQHNCSKFDHLRHMTIDGENVVVTATMEQLIYRGEGQGRGRRTVDALLDRPENATFSVIHSYHTSTMKTPVVNPHTIVRDHQGRKVAEFAAGEFISGISVAQWLEWAAVDLDSRNQLLTYRGGDPQQGPPLRISGVVLVASMTYTNRRAWERPKDRPRCTVRVRAVPEGWGFGAFDGGDADGAPVRLRNGVKIQFVQGGSIGDTSIVQIVAWLVELWVLLRVVGVVSDQAARNCMPNSRVYRDKIIEKVDGHMVDKMRRQSMAPFLARARGNSLTTGSTQSHSPPQHRPAAGLVPASVQLELGGLPPRRPPRAPALPSVEEGDEAAVATPTAMAHGDADGVLVSPHPVGGGAMLAGGPLGGE